MDTEEVIKQLTPNWDFVKDLVMPRLVHRDVDVSAYGGYTSLDMHAYIVVHFGNRIYVKATPTLMQIWGKTRDEVVAQALLNMHRTFADIKCSTVGDVIEQTLDMKIPPEKNDPVILTTENRTYGAVAMLDKTLMNRVANHFDVNQLVVLPSSVHEVLVSPFQDGMVLSELDEMVREVNKTQVDKDEWLSDHAYIYDINTGYHW